MVDNDVRQVLRRLVPTIVAIRQADPDTLGTALANLLEAVRLEVTSADYAGIIVSGERANHAASSIADHPNAVLLDEAECRHAQGPARHAALQRQSIIVEDITTDRQWPKYAHDVARFTPVRSVAAIPMHDHRKTLGSLMFYAEQRAAFRAEEVEMAGQYAALAAAAWSAVAHEDQLKRALVTRDVISQAKGILMERYRVPDGKAFDQLRRISARSNTPVLGIAERLVRDRQLPGLP